MYDDEHRTAAAAITKIIRRAEQAQNDVTALMSLHSDDAVIVNLAGRRIVGKKAFEQAMRAALGSSLAEVTTTVEISDITFVDHATAIASCVKSVHDNRDGVDAALPSRGALTYVLALRQDAWQIVLAQTTPMRQ